MEGKTKSGFKYKVDERAFSDWRFVLAVSKTQSGQDARSMTGATEMVELLLGNEGHKALIEHVAASHDGYAPAEVIMAEVSEIIQASTKAKN